MAPQIFNQTAPIHYVSIRNGNLLHADRVKQDLLAAGLTRYGLKKFAVHYLPRIIHTDERIMAAVYGRYGSNGLFNSLNEGMLIATDKRILFVDHKPGFTDIKEFPYDIVSGVELVTTAFFSGLTLYTKIGDFNIHYANPQCVEHFTEYVEMRRLEIDKSIVRKG